MIETPECPTETARSGMLNVSLLSEPLPPMVLPAAPPVPKQARALEAAIRKAIRMSALVFIGFEGVMAAPWIRDFIALGFLMAIPMLLVFTFTTMVYDMTKGNAAPATSPKVAAWTALCFVGASVYVSSSLTSPVMLDLKGRGAIGTTGNSTAKVRIDRFIGRTVDFDLAGNGRSRPVEWSNGDGAGFLVDDQDGTVTRAARTDGRVDGRCLFGDQGGQYASGYAKLALRDTNHDGKLTGAELAGLAVWVDNGDARVQPGELQSLATLGISEIDVTAHAETNARGEVLARAGFTQRGQRKLTEDVWFAQR